MASAPCARSPRRRKASARAGSQGIWASLRITSATCCAAWSVNAGARFRSYAATPAGIGIAKDFQEDVLAAAEEMVAPHSLWTQVQLATELSRIEELLQHWRG